MTYKILVVWLDGEQEFLKKGSDDAIFHSRDEAKEQAELMKKVMSGDYESISVVRV